MPFNEFLKRLLGQKKKGPTCKSLKRSQGFKTSFYAWQKAQTHLPWTSSFFKAYHYKKAHLPSPLQVELIDETNRQGVKLFFDTSIGADNFIFLFELLKERATGLGYVLHNSNKLEACHGFSSEQMEKYLFTPPATDLPGTGLCNQLYGNILLDYVQVNKQPGYIRLVTNTYPDTCFSAPLPFTELLELLLQPGEALQRPA
jgi:hypothetical protein